MSINKVYPQLRCQVCGEILQTEEPDTEYVFLLLVLPCKTCAAQQSVIAYKLRGEIPLGDGTILEDK